MSSEKIKEKLTSTPNTSIEIIKISVANFFERETFPIPIAFPTKIVHAFDIPNAEHIHNIPAVYALILCPANQTFPKLPIEIVDI